MKDPVFPDVIDNTMLTAWRRCPQYFFRRYIQGLQPKEGISIDLHFGQCVAAGMQKARECYYLYGDVEDAKSYGIATARERWDSQKPDGERSGKTERGLISALGHMWNVWPLEAYKPAPGLAGAGIEFAFEISVPVTHPEDPYQQLKFGGRCDFVCQDSDGDIVIIDEKTSGNLSDAWMTQWAIDPQVTGYVWALQQILPHANVSAQVHGISVYGLKRSGEIRVNHVNANVFRTKYQIDVWYNQMLRDLVDMRTQWYHWTAYEKDSAWSYHLGNACTAYGRPCEFMGLCNSSNPKRLLDQFDVKLWKPTESEQNDN